MEESPYSETSEFSSLPKHVFIPLSLCCAVLSCPVMCDPLHPHGQRSLAGCSPWGFSRQEYCSGLPCPPPGSSQPRRSSQPRDQTQVSCIAGRFFTLWASREAQEYWSGQPIPSPGELHHTGIEPGSPALQADSLPAELPRKPNWICIKYNSH